MASTEESVKFECSLGVTKNIRVLGAAFQCMAKLGKEVVLEAVVTHSCQILTFRCVNDAKTSFVAFEFRNEFFEQFNVLSEEGVTAKIKLKSCLTVFRSMTIIERLVISLVVINHKHVIMFRAECKHAVTKTHQFYYEDSEALDPQFDRDGSQHFIQCRSKLWIEALRHIHGTEEIKIEARAGLELSLSSYYNSVAAASSSSNTLSRAGLDKNVLTTQMLIPKDDFNEFQITKPSAVLIFSVKEFRALLQFAEKNSVDLDTVLLLFSEPGEPLMFTSLTEGIGPSQEGFPGDMNGDNMKLSTLKRNYGFTLVISTIPMEEIKPTTLASSTSIAETQ